MNMLVRSRSQDRKRFCLVLIKPSHYDENGYVIQWLRSPIPSNSLASLYGLAKDCAERRVLGDDVELDIHAFDETNTRIRPEQIAKLIETAGAGVVMLTGVQSNQFPRALDIARPLRRRGIAVAVGGFHVSGTLSMLEGVDADLDRARAMGLSLFAGEAEGRLEDVLRDSFNGSLKPLYNFMNDLPNIEGTPIPLMAAERAQRTAGGVTSFDAGRGCPYQCSFCTIINVQGRISRRRSADDVEQIVRVNYAQGLRSFFITDDNFARNKDWEAILDRLIHLRQVEKLNIGFIIQVDTLCHKLPNFVEKCASAGVRRVFIGLENINPDNLLGAKKRQNKITEYRKMLLAWKKARVITYAGYILGFPNDTVESILHDIDVIKRELPVDLLEFFFLTPLPGSEDHLKLHRAGAPLDPDLNKYDLNHVCTTHSRMSSGGVGARLSARMAALLHDRAYRDGSAQSGLERSQCQQCDVSYHLVQGQHRLREYSSARKRIPATEIPPRPAGILCDRADLAILSEIFHGIGGQAGALGHALLASAPHLSAHQARSATVRLHGSGDEPGRGRGSGNAGVARHGFGASVCQ